MITQNFKDLTEAEKKSYVDMLKEVHMPRTSRLLEPSPASIIKGRPKGSTNRRKEAINIKKKRMSGLKIEDISTTRSPSLHEHVLASLAGTSWDSGAVSTNESTAMVESNVRKASPSVKPKRKYVRKMKPDEVLNSTSVSSTSSRKQSVEVEDDMDSVQKKAKYFQGNIPSVHEEETSMMSLLNSFINVKKYPLPTMNNEKKIIYRFDAQSYGSVYTWSV